MSSSIKNQLKTSPMATKLALRRTTSRSIKLLTKRNSRITWNLLEFIRTKQEIHWTWTVCPKLTLRNASNSLKKDSSAYWVKKHSLFWVNFLNMKNSQSFWILWSQPLLNSLLMSSLAWPLLSSTNTKRSSSRNQMILSCWKLHKKCPGQLALKDCSP